MNNEWYRIYKNNMRLDSMFDKKYSDDNDYIKKNCIEFLVELGEFVNETKCFKYWSIKKPIKEKVLEEYSDCITMILFFFGKMNLDLENLPKPHNSDNILDVINNTYLLGTELIDNCNENLLKRIFSNLIYISKLLNIKEKDIIIAIDKKQMVIEERLNSEY